MKRLAITHALLTLFLGAASALAAAGGPTVQALAPNLYAYISDNDGSANSTFLIGPSSILVVDAGLNRTEGGKILREIRKLSPLPVAYIVNTHYHPDHQGGDGVVGPNATVISSPFTRDKTAALAARISGTGSPPPANLDFALHPADITFSQTLTVYVGDDPVEIVAAWPAHTMGDVYVYFPKQRTVSTGDLYLTNSAPAMDEGSAAHWIEDLNQILSLPADHFVPGHFEVGTRQTLQSFRDYMVDLDAEVQQLMRSGATEDQIRQGIRLPKYKDFRQFPNFKATFDDNAVSIFHQIQNSK